MPTQIHFTRERLQELKRKHEQAAREGREAFLFEGQKIVTSYAKYLIEYLEHQFGGFRRHRGGR